MVNDEMQTTDVVAVGEQEKAKIWIVDDDPNFCNFLATLLSSLHVSVVSYSTATAFFQEYNETLPGCILLDIRLPVQSGLAMQKQLVNNGCQAPIIFMTGHNDIPVAVLAMKRGAFDVLVKPVPNVSLLSTVERAVKYNQEVRHLLAYYERKKTLTHREGEIFERIITGMMNKVIAHELHLSMKTVEIHRKHIMQKMQVKTLAELVELHSLWERHHEKMQKIRKICDVLF